MDVIISLPYVFNLFLDWNHQVIQIGIYFGTEKEYILKLLDQNHHIFQNFWIVVSVWIYDYSTKDVMLSPCISRVGTISSATTALLLSILL